MPTLPLFASESALAVSSSLLSVFSVTSPVPALTCRAGRDDRLGVVRDDVDRDGAGERERVLVAAGAGLGLGRDVVLGEAEEIAGGRAGVSGSAVPSPRNVHAEPFHL